MTRNTNDNFEENYAEEEEESQKGGVTFKDIFKMIGKHWIALIICALLGLAAGVVYGTAIKSPEYVSTGTVTVYPSSGSTTDPYTKTRDVCLYMQQSRVRNKVCEDLVAQGYTDYLMKDSSGNLVTDEEGNKVYNVSALAKQYSASVPTTLSSTSGSIFINVSATTDNAVLSQTIVNLVMSDSKTLVEGGDSVIASALGVSLSYDSATYPTDTSTSNVAIAAIGTLIGLLVGAVYGIVRELTNTRVNSRKELEAYTGFKVIGMIPNYKKQLEDEEADEESQTAAKKEK